MPADAARDVMTSATEISMCYYTNQQSKAIKPPLVRYKGCNLLIRVKYIPEITEYAVYIETVVSFQTIDTYQALQYYQGYFSCL